MKKIGIILSSLFIFSCSSDDSNSNYSALIIGEWNYVEMNVNGAPYPFEEFCYEKEYMIFAENGVYGHTEFDNPTGNDECIQVASTEGYWSIDDDVLTVGIPDNFNTEVSATILELSDTTFQYKITGQDLNEDDQEDVAVYTMVRRN